MDLQLNSLKPLPPIKSAVSFKEPPNDEKVSPPVEVPTDVVTALERLDSSVTNSLLTQIFSLTEPTNLPQQQQSDLLPSEALNVNSLKRLEKGFLQHSYQRGKNGGVGVGLFVSLWHGNVYPYHSEKELGELFLKIDANCTGLVRWMDFLTYIWMEMSKLDLMKVVEDRAPYPSSLHIACAQKERNAIVSLQLIHVNVADQPPTEKKWESLFGSAGRYISLCHNGMLRIYSLTCSLLDSFNLKEFHRKSRLEIAATDMAIMSNMRLIAVSFANSHSIHFYCLTSKAVQGYSLSMAYNIRRLAAAPLCMEYIVSPSNHDISHLVWGDTHGSVCVLNFTAAATKGPFGQRHANEASEQCDLNKIQQGKYSTVNLVTRKIVDQILQQVHDDWVLKIRSCTLLFDYGFVSCSKGSKVSVYYCDLIGSHSCGSLGLKRGTTCVEYCEQLSAIYAGCVDGKIRIIKPSPRRGLVAHVLHGHIRAVTALALDPRRQLLISAGEDQRLIVYKIGKVSHMQVLDISLGSFGGIHHVSSLFVNTFNSSLLIATHCIGMLEHHETMDHTGQATLATHDGSCTQALYNPLFDTVVSGDVKSTLCIWKLKTGKKVIEFRECHQKKVNGYVTNQEIVSMSFDPSLRRLITGARDGTANIWNVNNGMLLRKMNPRQDNKYGDPKKGKNGPDNVLGLLWSEENNRIALALSGKKAVYTYIDEPGNEECYSLPVVHDTDITCMVRLPPTLIATCSTGGDIVIRSLITGKPMLMFNAAISTSSILEKRVDNYKTKLEDGRLQAKSTLASKDDKMMTAKYRRYSSVQKPVNAMDELSCKAGDESSTYLYDTPRYKHMALAASLGYKESAIQEQSSIEEMFSDENKVKQLAQPSSGTLTTTKESMSTNWTADLPDVPMSNSIDCVVALLNRVNTRYTATLVTGGADGWVRAWSTTFKGELLGQFNASHHKLESIMSIAVDQKNEYLITGDSEGYIKVWDIHTYCLDEQQLNEVTSVPGYLIQKVQKYSQFVLLSHDMNKLSRRISRRLRLRSLLAMHGLPPLESEPLRTLRAPALLNSFRGHMQGITSLSYIDRTRLIISSSTDGNVRLWSLHGLYIGHFGQSISWDIDAVLSSTNKTKLLPHDVKRVASSTTLTVWNGGTFKRWNRLRAVCLAAGLTSFLSSQFKTKTKNEDKVESDEKEGKYEQMKEALTLKSGWAKIAAMIKLSVIDYIKTARKSALRRLNEKDEAVQWIAESLNPSPTDKDLTAVIKTIWWKSLRFEMLKLGDEIESPTPTNTGSRVGLNSSFRRLSKINITVNDSQPSTPISLLGLDMKASESLNTELISRKLQTSSTDIAEKNTASQPVHSPTSSGLESESLDRRHAWRRLSVSSRDKHRTSAEISADDLALPTCKDFAKSVHTSKYLGRCYKRLGGHKPLPKIDPPKMYDSTYAVFSALPFVKMESFKAPPLPDNLQKFMATRQVATVDFEPKPKKKEKRRITTGSQGTKASLVPSSAELHNSPIRYGSQEKTTTITN